MFVAQDTDGQLAVANIKISGRDSDAEQMDKAAQAQCDIFCEHNGYRASGLVYTHTQGRAVIVVKGGKVVDMFTKPEGDAISIHVVDIDTEEGDPDEHYGRLHRSMRDLGWVAVRKNEK